jgi:hypothetical protein
VDVRGMVCVVFLGKKRRATGRLVLACNSGRDTPTAGRSGQEGSVAEGYIPSWGVGEESSEECSPCLSWNQQRMLNSDSQR